MRVENRSAFNTSHTLFFFLTNIWKTCRSLFLKFWPRNFSLCVCQSFYRPWNFYSYSQGRQVHGRKEIEGGVGGEGRGLDEPGTGWWQENEKTFYNSEAPRERMSHTLYNIYKASAPGGHPGRFQLLAVSNISYWDLSGIDFHASSSPTAGIKNVPF